MNLLHDIRGDRSRQRRKQPHRSGVFTIVSSIVKQYSLGQSFLELINKTDDYLTLNRKPRVEVKEKKAIDLPPFSLVPQEEYRLVMTILDKLANPYLQFARTPIEMLLSVPLYQSNPGIRSESLLRYDFETLLLWELERRDFEAREAIRGS